ncbi:hypothetical protein XENTR_v10013201 [Xenopus tropicalis]|nr:hypothetical protein XENTR_v10013201 [Xenopus tropicalis]
MPRLVVVDPWPRVSDPRVGRVRAENTLSQGLGPWHHVGRRDHFLTPATNAGRGGNLRGGPNRISPSVPVGTPQAHQR